MKVVGLTGGIGTGKSTVGSFLREAGVPVIDADQVARDVVEPGQPALVAIADAFGPDALGPDGRLDRAAMRSRIATDPDARRTLEAITHPAIAQAIGAALAALAARGVELAVVEAALMVETGSYRLYQALVVVTCSPDTQIARVLDRDGGTPDQARALLAAQLPMADKEAVASHIIRNEGSLEDLRARTSEVLEALRAA